MHVSAPGGGAGRPEDRRSPQPPSVQGSAAVGLYKSVAKTRIVPKRRMRIINIPRFHPRPIPGLSESLRATLIYLRHNIVQAAIGEFPGMSQPTVSRAVRALTETSPGP